MKRPIRLVLVYHLYNIFVLNYWGWVLLGFAFLGLAAMGYLGWGWTFFGLATILNIMSRSYDARKSNALDSYIVCLLLDDETREKQKGKFQEWIRSENAPD